MILVPFFEIPHGDRLDKNVKSRCVQVIPRSMAYGNEHLLLGIGALFTSSLNIHTYFNIHGGIFYKRKVAEVS